jgi:hypothetical protein
MSDIIKHGNENSSISGFMGMTAGADRNGHRKKKSTRPGKRLSRSIMVDNG